MASVKRSGANALEIGSAKKVKVNGSKAETTQNGSNGTNGHKAKKQILLNAFDMSTVGHLSPGQWKVSSSVY
jgi:hypothetical protein